MDTQQNWWCLDEEDLAGLSPRRARDLVVECLLRAQGDAYHQPGMCLERETGERELRVTVVMAVRLKFADLGLSWDDPKPEDIIAVMRAIAGDTLVWGTQEAIVQHQAEQLRRIEEALQGDPIS